MSDHSDDAANDDPFNFDDLEVSPRDKYFYDYCATREPLEQLPPGLTVDRSLLGRPYYNGPVKLLYGFGTTVEDLFAYAKKINFLTDAKLQAAEDSDDAKDREYLLCDCVKYVEKYLRWETRARLRFRTPVHVKYDTVITLWDNYTMEDMEMDEEDTGEVLGLLREALGMKEDEQPLWYFEAR